MTTSSSASSSRVLLLGSRGYLGQRFLSLYPGALSPEVDVADAPALAGVLDSWKPEIVINCAGRTGRPNIDWCEDHKAETLRANLTGALLVLDECIKRNIYLVHLSSGCIYEGDNGGRGFAEDDPPNYFRSFYSRSKIWAEQVLRTYPVLILRLRMPFDGSLSERNLIMKVRGYRRVLVEPNSLTHLPDFLKVSRELISRRATGVYNVVNEGAMSPYQIMLRYQELVDPTHTFVPLSLWQLDEVAPAGRSNCLLSTAKLQAEGLHLPAVNEALDGALRTLALAVKPRENTLPGWETKNSSRRSPRKQVERDALPGGKTPGSSAAEIDARIRRV